MPVAGHSLELLTLAAYLVVLLGIGLRSARQVRTSLDYTLAGRDVPWVVVLATTAATMIGGGASVGMVSRVYELGIAAALVTCAWHLQLIFTGLFVAPKLRGLNLITVGDYFELKFGRLARELAVINCLIFLVGAITAQMAAIGTIANTVLEIDYELALFVGAAVTVFYSTVGGIRAVVKTDVLQFVILIIGIGAASALLVQRNGGIAAMLDAAGPAHFELTSQWSTTRLVSLFVAFLLGETLVPPYTVRCFIARDSRQAKWGVAGAGFFLLLFLPMATFVLGVSAQIDPQVSQITAGETQKAFPTLVRTTFHPAFSGIVLAALIAAVMSSADSCLSCLSTVVMEDQYHRHLNPKATDRQLLRVAKWTTFVAGIGAAACAYFFRNIADVLEFVYDFWAPTMILPFLVGVFWYRPSRIYAVVAAMIGGMLTTIVWRFVLHSPWDLSPAMFGVAAAIAVYLVALPLTNSLTLGSWFQPSTDAEFDVPTDSSAIDEERIEEERSS